MDPVKTGKIIHLLRKEKGLTQKQLAEKMFISDKTVSKWECGAGCPEISLLRQLADILDVEIDALLKGQLDQNDRNGGNMKNLKFYVCPVCGNLLTATGEASVSCCGKVQEPTEIKKAESDEKLSVELIDNEYFVSSSHEMTKDHYITFVALLTSDTLILRKQYPEWDLQTRIPRMAHGRLIWHCSKHGMFSQLI